MKIKLFYKIYFVVLFSVIMSVGVSILVVGFYGSRNFRDYIAQSKAQEFSWLAEKLGEFYKKHGSFEPIRQYRLKFESANFDRDDKGFPHQMPPMHGGPVGRGNGGPEAHPTGGPDGGFHGFPHDGEMGRQKDFGFRLFGPGSENKKFTKERNEILVNIFYNEKTGINIPALIKFQEFIAVFDKDKKLVTGVEWENDKHEYMYTPILSDGVTVGYIGIRKPPNLDHQLAGEFLSQQLNLMIFSAVLIILITGLASWIFTRKVISPVSGLIVATRKLASRDFDIDLKPESKDELGDLAVNFRKMADDLRMYEHKQNRWISDISHELRTPLSVLLGSIEAMQDGVRKMDSDTMNVLHDEVKRLIKLVNELHDITLAESGGMKFDFISVRMNDVLDDVISLYQSRAKEYGFKLESMTKHCDAFINGDIARLRQVFINIIENSLKHAKSPGTIFVGCSDRDGVVTVAIEDSGPGVPDEHLPMLFDRLFRSDNSRNRMTGGSGLGLAICKYIIQKHSGRITASHSAMGGLKIEIEIPMENRHE